MHLCTLSPSMYFAALTLAPYFLKGVSASRCSLFSSTAMVRSYACMHLSRMESGGNSSHPLIHTPFHFFHLLGSWAPGQVHHLCGSPGSPDPHSLSSVSVQHLLPLTVLRLLSWSPSWHPGLVCSDIWLPPLLPPPSALSPKLDPPDDWPPPGVPRCLGSGSCIGC